MAQVPTLRCKLILGTMRRLQSRVPYRHSEQLDLVLSEIAPARPFRLSDQLDPDVRELWHASEAGGLQSVSGVVAPWGLVGGVSCWLCWALLCRVMSSHVLDMSRCKRRCHEPLT